MKPIVVREDPDTMLKRLRAQNKQKEMEKRQQMVQEDSLSELEDF